MNLHIWRVRFVCCLFCASVMPQALASRRALVVGSDSYPGNALRNARNDARSMSERLHSLGYITTLQLDLNRLQMIRTIDTFANSLEQGDTALLYYAGHGVQVDGENYLIPIDFAVSDEADVKTQGYSLSSVLSKLTAHGAQTQVIILDACRNNPFLAKRGGQGGWASVGTSVGTLLVFGTAPGSTASDEAIGGHGLFTRFLLQHMDDPTLDADQLFGRVRTDVVRASQGAQVPWTSSSLVGAFHMVPAADAGASPLNLSLIRSLEQVRDGVSLPLSTLNKREVVMAAPRDTEQQSLLLAATTDIRGIRFADAVNTLKTVLAIDPRCAVALRLLGIALHLLGRNIEAEKALTGAITVDPKDSRAYAYRCLINADQDVSAAADDCRVALESMPQMPEAHVGMGITLLEKRQYAAAEAEITKAITLDPNTAQNYVLRGDLAAAQHQEEEAHDNYIRATAIVLSAP